MIMDGDPTLDTYRYLRGGIPVMLVMLLASMVIERTQASCWQTSISAYYFTAVHAVFIGAICAIGTLLIVYKGNKDTEDVLLNVAGILAFVVAFVPTSRPVLLCGTSALPVDAVSYSSVVANVWALVITLLLARAASWWMYHRTGTVRKRSALGTVAVWVQRVVLGAGLVTLTFAPTWFVTNAHGIAAVAMFAAFIGTVLITAFLAGQQDPGTTAHPELYHRIYQAIAIAMMLTLVAAVVVHFTLDDFNHVVLIVELLLIAQFGAYWVVQTVELWSTSTRAELEPAQCKPADARLMRAL